MLMAGFLRHPYITMCPQKPLVIVIRVEQLLSYPNHAGFIVRCLRKPYVVQAHSSLLRPDHAQAPCFTVLTGYDAINIIHVG